MSARVIIVNGLPGVGKTTQAQALATGLGWPLVTKDMFKESLFDSLGWSDRAWSRKLSKASMDLLFVWLDRELQAGRDCVIEANFESERDTPRFVALADRYAVQWVQVLVVCDGDTLWQRHIARGNDGSRHPGHQEAAVALELRERLLTGRVAPLALDAPCIELDTTDFMKIDAVAVMQRVRDCFLMGDK
jgi:predicted kinase